MRKNRIGIWLGILLGLAGNLLAQQQLSELHIQGKSISGAENLNLKISPDQARAVGQRIWKNECGGTVSGLTSWNKGEPFPSLGIGHFIWYPTPGVAPFEESFPGLIGYFQERGITIPVWLARARYCPWKTREKFLSDQNSLRLKELRHLLAETVGVQCDYIARRLAFALPKMLNSIPDFHQRKTVSERFITLFRTPEGLFALMDYVNFKGEGTKDSERYAGKGWGMLQVLQEMKNCPRGLAAVREFAASACRVLERRVTNAPPDRQNGERRWLPVWKDRLRGYIPSN